jgi:hypothetical protein
VVIHLLVGAAIFDSSMEIKEADFSEMPVTA